MKEEHAQELAQLIEDELPRSYGSVRPRVPTHSAHRRPEALREGQHALVAHGLRLRAPARRHLDEAVDAGLVEVLALVLLHHARLHHVEGVAHARRHEPAVDGRARAVDEAARRRVVRGVEVPPDPLLAAVVAGNAAHRQQARAGERDPLPLHGIRIYTDCMCVVGYVSLVPEGGHVLRANG